MEIRFKNWFLLLMGTIFYAWSWFTTSLVPSFMFGVCFGLIYLNYKDEKDNN